MATGPLPSDDERGVGPPRSVGLVLGAGGVAGWAWLVGSLAGLEEVAGWDARAADLIVGTSAGAGVAAVLRGGRSAVEQLADYQAGAHGPPGSATQPTGPAGAVAPGSTPPGAASTAAATGAASTAAGTASTPAATAPAPAGSARAGATTDPVPAGPDPVPAGPDPRPLTNPTTVEPAGPDSPPLVERLTGGSDPDGGPPPSPSPAPAGGAATTRAGTDGDARPGGGSTRDDARPGPQPHGRAWPKAPQLALLSLTRWPPRPGLALAGLLPRGRHRLDDLGRRLSALHGRTWPTEPLWITAIRADTGRRVVFGRDPGPGADGPPDVATAVRASAAVPGWYEPVRIGEHDHLDGGSWSSTNADLVAGLGFDVAVVLAPMSVADAHLGRSRNRWRRAYHRSVLSREVDLVHRNGTDAVVLEPHPDDLALLAARPDEQGEVDVGRRLAIAERARQRVVERLADDPSLAAAVRREPRPEAAG